MNNYKTYVLKETELDFWDDYINDTTSSTIFHKIEWLMAAAEHTKMQFMPLAVSKGKDIICLFPLFYKKKYGLRVLLSPPNRCGISYLGPVFNIPSSNRYNYEWTYINVIDEIIKFAEQNIGFDYFRIIHAPGVGDMRPYIWKGYSVQPKYTYEFNLSEGEKELYDRFHTTAKNKKKRAMSNNNISIYRDRKFASEILSLAEKRSVEQKFKFRISANYFNKLINSSFSDNIESIVVKNNGNIIAGSIDLIDRTNTYAWIATFSKEESIPGVGELILWEKIKDYHNRGFEKFDIVDANIRRLCRHKSRYGANLVNYFDVHKTSIKGKIALGLMNKYKRRQND